MKHIKLSGSEIIFLYVVFCFVAYTAGRALHLYQEKHSAGGSRPTYIPNPNDYQPAVIHEHPMHGGDNNIAIGYPPYWDGTYRTVDDNDDILPLPQKTGSYYFDSKFKSMGSCGNGNRISVAGNSKRHSKRFYQSRKNKCPTMNYSKAFLFSVMILAGCHSDKPKPVAIDTRPALIIDEKLPRAVHNVCLNVWAVKTEEAVNACFDCGWTSLHPEFFFGHQLANKDYGTKDQDSSSHAEIGNEYQFKDSATAMRVYNAFCYRRDRPKQVADSIFNCHHSYNK